MRLGTTIRDTGISVDAVLKVAAEGLSIDQIVAVHSALTLADVASAFRVAATAFQEEPVLALDPLPIRICAISASPADGLQLRVVAAVNDHRYPLSPKTL